MFGARVVGARGEGIRWQDGQVTLSSAENLCFGSDLFLSLALLEPSLVHLLPFQSMSAPTHSSTNRAYFHCGSDSDVGGRSLQCSKEECEGSIDRPSQP